MRGTENTQPSKNACVQERAGSSTYHDPAKVVVNTVTIKSRTFMIHDLFVIVGLLLCSQAKAYLIPMRF